MRKILMTGAAAAAAVGFAISPAAAATNFTTTFNGLTPTGSWTTLGDISDESGGIWEAGNLGIEVQQGVAGSSFTADPNDVFVELDTGGNSSMSHAITAGAYTISFLYSQRPGIALGSNGISVTVGGLPALFTLDGAGAGDTIWRLYSTSFIAAAATTLTFAATGTSDSLGGYLDNITLTAVPEPGTWALMIGGFGAMGSALRKRRRVVAAALA